MQRSSRVVVSLIWVYPTSQQHLDLFQVTENSSLTHFFCPDAIGQLSSLGAQRLRSCSLTVPDGVLQGRAPPPADRIDEIRCNEDSQFFNSFHLSRMFGSALNLIRSSAI